MKLPPGNAEELATHMSLLSQNTMETNITVNWTGGGQINECKYPSRARLHELTELTL